MNIISLVLAILKFLNYVMDTVGRERLKQDGRDEEIARATAALLAKTQWAQDVKDKIASMDEAAVDSALRDLEPK